MSPIKLSILLLSFALCSCSFKPVHAKLDSGLANTLASVQVSDIRGREGQLLKYKLTDLLSPDSSSAYPNYRLDIELVTNREDLGIQENLRITRYNIVQTANYKLVALQNNQIADEGAIKVKSSYNRTESEFATFVAEEDSSEKAAEELAQLVKQRLTAYFAKY